MEHIPPQSEILIELLALKKRLRLGIDRIEKLITTADPKSDMVCHQASALLSSQHDLIGRQIEQLLNEFKGSGEQGSFAE